MKTSVVIAAAMLAFSSAQASRVGSAVSNSSVISEDVRSSVRLSSGPVAQTVAGGGTIVTRSGVPIGSLVPVTQDGEDEPELVFFPVDLVNINQFQAGAPGTDVNRIPEDIQEQIVESIREQIVAEKIENYKTENGLGETDEVDQSVVDGFTNEVASTPVNLQETLEISPDLDLSDYTL